MGEDVTKFDIVGVGALNVDFIATASAMAAEPALAFEFGGQFEAGTERPMNRDDALRLVAKHGRSFQHSLGGSSFNMINTAVEANPALRVGYVGVVGDRVSDIADFDLWFHNHPNIRAVVERYDDIQGICVSWPREGERTLRTHPGVNSRFADLLTQRRTEILETLCRTSIVHITSLFDPDSPALLVEILKEVRSRNPLVQFSFDPGHFWVYNINKDIADIFRIADFVFLNLREFIELGDFQPGDEYRDTAGRILKRFCPDARIVVLKKYNSISVFFNHGRGVHEFSYINETMSADEIEDATGAGDVFAGGFLSSRLDPIFDMKDSIEVALEMVKAKLKAAGATYYTSFNRLYEERLDIICKRNKVEVRAHQVSSFISSDFTEFRVGSHDYTFTSRQAEIVKYMVLRFLDGQRQVNGAKLAEDLGKPLNFRMTSAFQSSQAWGQLIRPAELKGAYSLTLTVEELDQVRHLIDKVR